MVANSKMVPIINIVHLALHNSDFRLKINKSIITKIFANAIERKKLLAPHVFSEFKVNDFDLISSFRSSLFLKK